MEALTELWLDCNLLTGPLPDMSNLINIKIVHLQNNKLTGPLPSYLSSLPRLQALFVQNNSFVGEVPERLVCGKIIFNYDGNPGLHRGKKKHFMLILGVSIGVLVILLLLFLGGLTAYSLVQGGNLMDESTACNITLSELKEATNNFLAKEALVLSTMGK